MPPQEVWAFLPIRAAQILHWTVKLIKMRPDECGPLVVPRFAAVFLPSFVGV